MQEVQRRSDWANFPDEIVVMLLEEVSTGEVTHSNAFSFFRDIVSMALTCRNWSRIIKNHHKTWISVLFRMYFACVQSLLSYEKVRSEQLFGVATTKLPSKEPLFCSILVYTIKLFCTDYTIDMIERNEEKQEHSDKTALIWLENHDIQPDLKTSKYIYRDLDFMLTFAVGMEKVLQYKTALDQASKTMKSWIQRTFPAVDMHRKEQFKTEQTAGDEPYFECSPLCPEFKADVFWYDIFRFCGSASVGYVTFWKEHEKARNIGQDGVKFLMKERNDTAAYYTRSVTGVAPEMMNLNRTWSIQTLTWSRAIRANKMEPEMICANMGCKISFKKTDGVRPLYNIPGYYCSTWCLFDDAFRDTEVSCAHDNCRHNLSLKNLLGVNWANRNYSMPETRGTGIFSRVTERRISFIEAVCRVVLTAKIRWIQPKTSDVPEYFKFNEWNPRLLSWSTAIDRSELKTVRKNDEVIPELAFGYLHPAQMDTMSRVYYGEPKDNMNIAYCSNACRKADASQDPPCHPPSIRCLNPRCRNVFDVEFATASFECLRVTFVSSKRERHLRGYVCDRICQHQYLKSRRHMATQDSKKRKRRTSNTDTDQHPKKKARTEASC